MYLVCSFKWVLFVILLCYWTPIMSPMKSYSYFSYERLNIQWLTGFYHLHVVVNTQKRGVHTGSQEELAQPVHCGNTHTFLPNLRLICMGCYSDDITDATIQCFVSNSIKKTKTNQLMISNALKFCDRSMVGEKYTICSVFHSSSYLKQSALTWVLHVHMQPVLQLQQQSRLFPLVSKANHVKSGALIGRTTFVQDSYIWPLKKVLW